MELEDFLDELNEKKNFKPLIIGFGELGTTIINKINMIEDYCFEAYLCNENNYNSILFNDNVMVVFVGNINNQKNLELLIKTINKKSNVFNIAFLNGCMIDKNIYNILDENEIFNFDTRNVEQIKSSPTPHYKSINSSALSFLYSPTLTSIHYHWKNHSLD